MRFLKASSLFLISMVPYSAKAEDGIVFIECIVNFRNIEPNQDKFVDNYNFEVNFDSNTIKMYMSGKKRYEDLCLGKIEKGNLKFGYSNCIIDKDKIKVNLNLDIPEMHDVEVIDHLKMDILIYRSSGFVYIDGERQKGNIRNSSQGSGTCNLSKELPDKSSTKKF